jgi:Replication-relaxation
MQITARDLALVQHVRRHRFLSSSQLVQLDGGNEANVLARLRKLFDHGYLERPPAQLCAVPVLGNQPIIYALGSKGARLLREHGHHLNATTDWTERTKRAGAIYLSHTVAVADFMISVELACRPGGMEIIREREILAAAPRATQSAREPLRWIAHRTANGRRETLSLVPDALFGLRFPDDTGTFFLLEIDRGTIPIARSGVSHRSIVRKLTTYIEGWRANRPVQQFGLKNLRALFVTSSPARMEHMLAAVDTITAGKGSGFLLFGHARALAQQDPLTFTWTNGRREPVRLID